MITWSAVTMVYKNHAEDDLKLLKEGTGSWSQMMTLRKLHDQSRAGAENSPCMVPGSFFIEAFLYNKMQHVDNDTSRLPSVSIQILVS